jgi:hypothetical protein
MNILGFFKRKKNCYSSYKQSSNASVYEQIADKLKTTTQHVYEIAHGKGLVCFDDFVIRDHLCQTGIVCRIYW